jgi:hypothetical protein
MKSYTRLQDMDQKENSNEFTENKLVTMETFPSINDLRNIFFRDDMNRGLNIVKNKILQAKNQNQTNARILVPDIPNAETANHVKTFLRDQGYTIVELETVEGAYQGWKIIFM